ncbi:MAG: ABC transporter substrate-binding protein, partial [Bdellovibrionales bacterium]|nr:ABC transporter substrate-binding protein [Bdellovibrionales bacterium]
FLRIKVIRDDLSRYLKLRAGELDVALNEMDYQKIDWILAGREPLLGAVTAPGVGFNYIGLNLADERLRDVRVRRALALSFDLGALVRYKSRNLATPAASILSPASRWRNQRLKPLQRNLDEARRLLDEAGWHDGRNEKPKLRLEFKTTNNPLVIENARVLAAQAREAGFEIVHRPFEWGIFYQDVKSGNTSLYMLRWVGVVDPGIYFEVFHSGPGAKSNRTRYKNPAMDAAVGRAMAATEFTERKKWFDEAQRIAAEDFPYVNLWHTHNAAAFRRETRGVRLHTNGSWRTFLSLEKKNEPILSP